MDQQGGPSLLFTDLDPERPSSTDKETKSPKLLLPDHMIYPLIYSFYKYLLDVSRVPGTLLAMEGYPDLGLSSSKLSLME